MSDIQLFSKKVRFLFRVFLIATPLFTMFYWLNVEQALLLEINPFSIPLGKVTFNNLSKILGFIVSVMPTMVVMALFYRLASLFKNYQLGRIFCEENVFCYKKLGKLLFLLACINFLCSGLMSLALSFQNPVGERFLALSFGTPQILPIIIGLVVMGISYVMEEAHHLEEDQRYTI